MPTSNAGIALAAAAAVGGPPGSIACAAAMVAFVALALIEVLTLTNAPTELVPPIVTG